MKVPLIVLALCFTLTFSTGSAPAQKDIRNENLDSLSTSFQTKVKTFTTPEFDRRKKVLRMFQQRGYVEVLSDVVAEDGVSALLSLIKVNAQIAYHLPHNQLVLHIPLAEVPRPVTQNPWHFLASPSQPYDIPLVQDWTFPADPWSNR
jgi:hypothetical protein